MRLVTYANTRAPEGLRVVVLIILDGMAKPLPTPHTGDDRAEVEARALAFGRAAERAQQAKHDAAKAAAAKRAEAKARKAGKS